MVQAAMTVALTPNDPEDVAAAANCAQPRAAAVRHTTPAQIFKGHLYSVLVFDASVGRYRRQVDQC